MMCKLLEAEEQCSHKKACPENVGILTPQSPQTTVKSESVISPSVILISLCKNRFYL